MNMFEAFEYRLLQTTRNIDLAFAVACAVLAIIVAILDLQASFAFIALGFLFTRVALRDQRRCDAIFARGIAAALAESDVDILDFAEAAVTLRPIALDGIKVQAPEPGNDPGPAPMLQWIKIADLVVDDAYQRHIGLVGRRNITSIAAGFRWSRFAPVVVSPVPGGKFAVVDGQHRATPALLVGFDSVPCQVIVAAAEEQARAFVAINGKVTRVSRLSLHKAAVAAEDAAALAIERVAQKAGARVLRYPKSELNQEPGETMAIGTIADCIRAYGEGHTVTALRVIVGTRNNVRGGLLAPIIAANALALSRLARRMRVDEPALISAFERINLIREMSKARSTERNRGTAVWTVLADRLTVALELHFGLTGKARAA